MTRDEYKGQLIEELREYEADIGLLASPMWERMKNIFRLRREVLMKLVMADNDKDAIQAQRLKGRFEETDYFLTLLESMRGEAAITLERLDEIETIEREERALQEQGAIL